MTSELKRKLEQLALQYYMTCGTHENEVTQSTAPFLAGAQAYESLLAEMAVEDVEAAREAVIHTTIDGDEYFADPKSFLLGCSHARAQSAAEIAKLREMLRRAKKMVIELGECRADVGSHVCSGWDCSYCGPGAHSQISGAVDQVLADLAKMEEK